MLRRRILDPKLAEVSAACKQADEAAEAALVRVGEALFALRKDARLEGLAPRLGKVTDAARLLREVQAAGKGDAASAREALSALDQQLAQVDAEIVELRVQEARAKAQFDALMSRARHAEALRLQAVQQIQALGAKQPADRARLAALASEREARNAERRMLEVQISPSETELAEARRDLAARLEAFAALHAQRSAIGDAMGRARTSREASLAAARSMQRTALLSLARAAVMADIVGFAGDAADAADDALARARALRDEEDVYKRARDSFDEDAYKQGLGILVGASIVAFVVLAGLILF